MIPSLCSGVTGRKETSAVASRLFSSSLLLAHVRGAGGAGAGGAEAFVDHAFALLSGSSKGDRATGYQLLSMIMSSGIKDGRMGSVFDRLPSLVATISSRAEGEALCGLVQTIMDIGTEDMMALLNKVLTKVASSCVRLMGKQGGDEEGRSSGMAILLQLAQSRSRSLLLPSNSSIKQACVALLPKAEYYVEASALLATVMASESPGVWSAYWLQLSRECVDLLHNGLGLHVSVNKSLACACPASNAVLAPLTGSRRAIAAEQLLRGKTQALTDLLLTGCASGAASLDLSAFLPTLLAMLSWAVPLSPLDAKACLANAQGVSPADLLLVAASLKLRVLGVAEALLQGRPPGLLRQAAAVCRPLLALLAGPEMRAAAVATRRAGPLVGAAGADGGALQALYYRGLACFSLACQCFPTVVARGGSAGLQALVVLLADEVGTMSSHRGPLGQAAGCSEIDGQGASSLDGDSAFALPASAIDRWLALLAAAEQLVLFCGPLLPAPLAASIERSVGVGLLCMGRGLLRRHGGEKKPRRAPAEALRCVPALQAALLQLAQAEVLTSARGGALSGNLSLLRAAAEAAFHQPETGAAALRCSLALEALLVPSAVALPAVPAASVAADWIAHRHKEDSQAAAAAGSASASAAAAAAGVGGNGAGAGAGVGVGAGLGLGAASAAAVDAGMERAWGESRRKDDKRKAAAAAATAAAAASAGAGGGEEVPAGSGGEGSAAAKRQKTGTASGSGSGSGSGPALAQPARVNVLGASAGSASATGAKGAGGNNDDDDDDELPELDADTAV